jgi:rifampicin phosphotransferase
MDTITEVFDLTRAATADRARVGGKAGVLGELAAAGFPVPPGLVVTAEALNIDGWEESLEATASSLGATQLAVRSSAAAEDLPNASYAGVYETYLNVPVGGLGEMVRRCFAAATAERVSAYHQRHGNGTAPGMAVLVQAMVDPMAAGVAFTAHPVSGDPEQALVTAVPGLGDRLVSGEAVGEEWTITTRNARMSRPIPAGGKVLRTRQAQAVADLARKIADRHGRPQDIEWAIDQEAKLWLLQARPMTAVPEPVLWTAPGAGLWSRNFRLGEWLPEAVTPLFATWLLPALEDGYLDGMQETVGVRVPFRYALVNAWYYNTPPIPTPKLLTEVLSQGRGRAMRIVYNALIRVNQNPAAADRAVLSHLNDQWRNNHLLAYRQLVTDAQIEATTATPDRLVQLVDQLGREAGIYLWYLAIVGGSAWKMEACLTRFCRQHLAQVLPEEKGGTQILLRGLPGTQPVSTAHAVLTGWVPGSRRRTINGGYSTDRRRPAAHTASPAARHGRASVPERPGRSTTTTHPVRGAAAGQSAVCGHPRGTGPRLHTRVASPSCLCPPAKRTHGRHRCDRPGR